jgi:hypothetical protein
VTASRRSGVGKPETVGAQATVGWPWCSRAAA